MHAPPSPWMKRDTSSTTMSFANPNTTLVTAMIASPSSIVGRVPARAASQPAGSEPSTEPAG